MVYRVAFGDASPLAGRWVRPSVVVISAYSSLYVLQLMLVKAEDPTAELMYDPGLTVTTEAAVVFVLMTVTVYVFFFIWLPWKHAGFPRTSHTTLPIASFAVFQQTAILAVC